MKKQLHKSTFLLAVALAACGGTVEAPEVNPTPHDSPTGPGLFSGQSGNLLDAFRSEDSGSGGSGIAVNPYLWRAAVEAIAFMPVVQADSNGGVLLTDWYTSAEQPNERVKVNVYVLSRSLRADGLRVAVFKQQKTAEGWQDVPASSQLVRELEDTILTNARVLRVKEEASK